MKIYGAFAHLLLADNFCQGTIKSGKAISDDSLYKRAESIFSEALQIATAAGALLPAAVRRLGVRAA